MRCVVVRMVVVVAAEEEEMLRWWRCWRCWSDPAGGRDAPPGNSRGCPAGEAGARRARSGGGAPGRAAGQRDAERPASPLGIPTPTPPPAKPEMGIAWRPLGEGCVCVRRSRGAGGKRPARAARGEPPPLRRSPAGCFRSGGISRPAVRAGSRTFSL